MNFAKNIAKRWKKSQAVLDERKKRIEERQMEKKAKVIANNAIKAEIKEETKEETKKENTIDIERKIAISVPKKTESGEEVEEQNIFSIKYLPRTGESWKETAKMLQVTDEEIKAIEEWDKENKE